MPIYNQKEFDRQMSMCWERAFYLGLIEGVVLTLLTAGAMKIFF